ncbi:DJ-1 family protein [Spiroplasma sabaudiense Ar-1343]|uniref:DJ-1 family protein n=1 Tax=Spiroplasma sabaudiense Ar-1343 TaxID=1276257 RepID=W6A9D0_9MOLU|nr:DJ-1 family glyoxalase III [Spiroplasma sabaudiense]AHI53723.1 DJ-1 family protein [Spiroplasma sabaudiense Ar-1343]
MKPKIAVFLASGFEEIEAVSTIDVLRRADFEVNAIAIGGDLMVEGSHKITIKADLLFDKVDFKDYDCLILPGGQPGTDNLMEFSPLRELLLNHAKQNKTIAAICAAPQILGMIGLADGKEITHYPGSDKYLEKAILKPHMASIEDGKIITGSSAGAALKFALQIIDHFTDTQNMLRIHDLLVMNY